MNPLRSLKIQIAIALLMIVALFAGVLAITMPALEEQRSFNTLQNITARLQHTVKGLVELAMNYTQNTPTDEASYQRDVKLYYAEIRRQINLFDLITNAFMSGVFSPALTNREHEFAPQLDPAVRTAVSAVEAAWIDFRAGLDRSLGMESKGPRLQQAADYITRKQMPLVESIDVLRAQIQRLASSRLDRVNQIHWISMLTVVVVTLGILAWFIHTILHPLSRAVEGFRSVAQGDFGYQVPLATTNELSSLTISFNQLSSRLHAIFQLIDRIQQGSDLDDTLRFVAEQLPSLLPLDWVGALFVAGDNTTVTLEKSYRDGQPEVAPRRHFKLQKTLLLKTLENDEPLHIPDMKSTAENNPNYQFLNYLVHTGLRDAIFLSVSEQSPIPGILAFATRKADSYTPEHLELLTNIAKLVTHSFGRTVKLAEHARLAAIGGFASGIAHEMRSPLSTIGLALEYLCNSQLPPPAEKRALLAQQESERLTRLSEEILLYAKPLQLNLATLEIDQFLSQFLHQQNSLLAQRNQHHQLTIDIDNGTIMGDKDRLQQVFLNLASNACEASPEGSRIDWRLSRDPRDQVLTLTISNPGVPISLATMERLFDPFFTTKPSGTGLGLGITRRIVHAHGGEMLIRPIAEGTEVRLLIPLA
ncbi:MAG: HAMP domain-containing protein [Gammaproteobacteria bacterium]|nr:HAMP domain-containing protein [Gammaproteobacteria bacterium]